MADSIGTLLSDVSRMMRRSFDERARTIGVTRPQWQVLYVLHRRQGSNQARLSELLDVEPITLCRMIDRLQDAELVERRRDPDDRRAWQLHLTETARQRLDELKPLGLEVLELALDGLSPPERDALQQTLHKMRQNLSRRTGEEEHLLTPEY